MKRILLFISAILSLGLAWAEAPAMADKQKVNKSTTSVARAEAPAVTDKQKISYAIARQVGENLRSQGLTVDVPTFTKALEEALAGKPSSMTPEAAQEVMKMAQAKVTEFRQAQGEKNKVEGKAFLDKNRKQKGVKTTKSGLQYKVEKEGSGPHPKASDRVKVNYKGTFIDGTEFDSSYKRGQPAEFPLNVVIPGWTEALQLMSPGAKFTVYIPGDLAYGDRGTPNVPPNSTLIFEVELLEILK